MSDTLKVGLDLLLMVVLAGAFTAYMRGGPQQRHRWPQMVFLFTIVAVPAARRLLLHAPHADQAASPWNLVFSLGFIAVAAEIVLVPLWAAHRWWKTRHQSRYRLS